MGSDLDKGALKYLLLQYTYVQIALNMAKAVPLWKVLFIVIVLLSVGSCLKKNKKVAAETAPEPNKTSPTSSPSTDTPTASVSAKQPSTSAQTAVSDKPKTQQSKKQQVKQKTEIKVKDEEPLVLAKEKREFYMKATENQYVMPIKVGEKTFALSLYYGDDQEYQKIPSWIFTSITKDHQLCDAEDDCQEVDQFVQCEPDKSKSKGAACFQDGKAKYSSEILESTKKATVRFENNLKVYISSFVSPSKATLKHSVAGQDQISGFMNLALNPSQKPSNSLTINSSIITILEQKQLKQLLQNSKAIDLTKTGMLSFSDTKDLYLRTKSTKDNKVTNSIKQNYKKVKVGFNRVQTLMGVTKGMMVVLKNLLKKEYFGDRCKIKDNKVTCSAQPIKKISTVSFCRSDDDKQCLELQILGMVISEQKPGVSYKLLIQENKQEEDNLILYPKFAEFFQIYAEKGEVKGVLSLGTKVEQVQSKKKEEEEEEEEEEKESENEEESVKKEEKAKSQKQSPKAIDSKSKKVQQKNQQDEKEEESEKPVKKEKASKKEQKKQQQEQQTQEEEAEQKQAPSKNKKGSTKHIESGLAQKGTIEEEQKYSRGILFFALIYGGIFVVILVVIKWKAAESVAAAAIDRFLEVTWYAIVHNYFNKNSGYNAPSLDEDEPRVNEEVDRSDSIAVGYSHKQGKELFWQNNSVQGI